MYYFHKVDRIVHPISGKEVDDPWGCNASSQKEADRQWLLEDHGSWFRLYCWEHDCYSRKCCFLHGCQGHHKGYITKAGHFCCSKSFGKGKDCRFKCQFDLSRISNRKQNRIRQSENSAGEPQVEVYSAESVGEGYKVIADGNTFVVPLLRRYNISTRGPGAK